MFFFPSDNGNTPGLYRLPDHTGRHGREYFPAESILAYFEFAPPAEDEVSRVVKDAVELAKEGLRMDLRELEEKTGYKLDGIHDL